MAKGEGICQEIELTEAIVRRSCFLGKPRVEDRRNINYFTALCTSSCPVRDVMMTVGTFGASLPSR